MPEWLEPVNIPPMPGSVRELAGICVGFPSESITVTNPPITIYTFETKYSRQGGVLRKYNDIFV